MDHSNLGRDELLRRIRQGQGVVIGGRSAITVAEVDFALKASGIADNPTIVPEGADLDAIVTGYGKRLQSAYAERDTALLRLKNLQDDFDAERLAHGETKAALEAKQLAHGETAVKLSDAESYINDIIEGPSNSGAKQGDEGGEPGADDGKAANESAGGEDPAASDSQAAQLPGLSDMGKTAETSPATSVAASKGK